MSLGPLSASTALTSWQLDLPALLLVVASAVAYLAGVRAVRRTGTTWSPLRSAAFIGGLALVVASTCSFVGVYARLLFWVFTLQVCLLLLVAPLLLGVGAPVALVTAVRSRVPGRRGAGGRAPATGRSRLLRVAGAPGVGPLLLIVVTVLVFFTPLLDAGLRHPVVFQSVHLLLLASGLLMVLPVTDDGMTLSSLGYAALVGLGFLEFLLDGIPGIALRLHGSVLDPGYWAALQRGWGPTPLIDQHLAGGMLWFFGEAGDLPFLMVAMIAWVKADAHEAARIDLALDLLSAQSVSPVALPDGATVPSGGSAPSGVPDSPDLERPWWETDASVFGEARARRNGWSTGEGPASARPES